MTRAGERRCRWCGKLVRRKRFFRWMHLCRSGPSFWDQGVAFDV